MERLDFCFCWTGVMRIHGVYPLTRRRQFAGLYLSTYHWNEDPPLGPSFRTTFSSCVWTLSARQHFLVCKAGRWKNPVAKKQRKIASLQILFLVLNLFFCLWEICQFLLTYTCYLPSYRELRTVFFTSIDGLSATYKDPKLKWNN